MKKVIKNLVITALIITSLAWFWHINNNNYKKHLEIKREKVAHPELLPDVMTAKFASAWYSNIIADKYWLETIQYIWSNAMASEYKKYLYEMTNFITDLNPYFEKPYTTTQLLLPSVNIRYEKLSQEEIDKHLQDSIKIWEKWVKNFCNATKIETINNEFDLNKLTKEDKYKNPCKSAMIPYFLAYIYHFYAHDWENAAKYYKMTAANEDAPQWAKILAAIMQWKGWDRAKSILMFLNMAKNVDNDEACKIFANDIDKIVQQSSVTWELLKIIETTRKKLIQGENIDKVINSNSCLNFVNKTTRELNLFYLEEANKKYKQEVWENADTPKILFNNWYIDYIPVDFQQEENYWIIYFFNPEISNYDYKMGYDN